MSNLLNNVIIFAAGAAIGSVVTWKIVENKYRQAVNDEIESLKEEYNQRLEEKITIAKSQFDDKPDIQEYVKLYGKAVNEEDEEYEIKRKKEDDGPVEPRDNGAYIIPPESYDENDDYDSQELTYYADGILTDEYGTIIEDVEELVVADFASHFGEYAEHAVYVRNEWLECDYEITRDLRNYHDVFPYNMED